MPSLPLTVVRQLHPDVLNWLDRVRQSGGSVPEYGVSAHNRYVNRMIDASIWAKVRSSSMIFTFATSDFNGCFLPFIAPNEALTPTNSNFVSGDYSISSGLDPGASNTNKYLTANYNLSTYMAAGSHYMCNYSTINRQSDGPIFRQNTLASPLTGIGFWPRYTDDLLYYTRNDPGSGYTTASVTDSRGLISASRTSTTDARCYRNGQQIGSTDTTASGSLSTRNEVWLFTGTSTEWSKNNSCYAAIFPGLTAAEESSHYQIVQQFQAAYGRSA